MMEFNVNILHAHMIECHDIILDNIEEYTDYQLQLILNRVRIILLGDLLDDLFSIHNIII